jgi:FixJ family two-component response regulator
LVVSCQSDLFPFAAPLVAILDDYTAAWRVIASLLESAGCRRGWFANTEAFLNTHPAVTCHCSIVYVRLLGINGFEFNRALTGSRNHLPAILASGHATEAMRQDALAAGAVQFLAKPFPDVASLESLRWVLPRPSVKLTYDLRKTQSQSETRSSHMLDRNKSAVLTYILLVFLPLCGLVGVLRAGRHLKALSSSAVTRSGSGNIGVSH